ncbi:hypothetical protein [Herbaspirillum rubrisubalbicans]|uniref:Cobalt transporter n=1 Tax=Herbaspirillum rubrisubalbicans TaxID=80842 RepID=A0AAD0XIE3_9BURK|nr:hypothetical protein [Herbaspirillum rubrisubalbicans]ALU91554.1 cobalt-zinc-cadmium resistance cation efflux system precursor protein [Herbaspirillum rubrisubalbicans M1]AYR26527.1 cobalt transporter [Herbaspirillum rubrisubalbicans]
MRTLILLLAFLLPVQLSWAAVGSYCQAENDRVPMHLGHHDHPSLKGDEQADYQKSKPGDRDMDCSLCHFCAMKSVQAGSTIVIIAPATAQASSPAHLPHPASHIADGPDKPNWPLAA